MELLAREDGWLVFSSPSPEIVSVLLVAASAVTDAVAKSHALGLPGDGSPVLADERSLPSIQNDGQVYGAFLATLLSKHGWSSTRFHTRFADSSFQPLQMVHQQALPCSPERVLCPL